MRRLIFSSILDVIRVSAGVLRRVCSEVAICATKGATFSFDEQTTSRVHFSEIHTIGTATHERLFLADSWTFTAKELTTLPLLTSFEWSCGQCVATAITPWVVATVGKTHSNTQKDGGCRINSYSRATEPRYWRAPNDVYYAFSPSILNAQATLPGRFASS
jgi:hypothetical protein